jgi:predicted naringenin-chalcone synthase
LGIEPDGMSFSREVLRRFGNMSSPTIMFVLRDILFDQTCRGEGFAAGFGPGLSAETLTFRKSPM